MINDQARAAQAGAVRSSVTRFSAIDISAYCNNRGISSADAPGDGRFNVWGNSFPAEHLPPAGAGLEVAGVPFTLAAAGPGGDNVRCAGQLIPVPAGEYDWIHVLAASERRAEDALALHFADASVDFEPLRVSDFWARAEPAFGDRRAVETPVMHYPHHVQRHVGAQLWGQRIPVSRRAALRGVRLPRNQAIHVFALTVQEAALG